MVISNNDYRLYSDYLMHHGILGMKWGIRRYQNPDGTLTTAGKKRYSSMESSDRTYNLEKFGKDKDHNVLYITGLSGSGKSHLANNIAKEENAEIISLDNYFMRKDTDGDDYVYKPNKKFDEFLKKEVPEFNYGLTGKDRILALDKVIASTKKYGEQKFGKNKVIVEGLQLTDPDLFGDNNKRKDFFKDSCFIAKGTSVDKAKARAMLRTIFEYHDLQYAAKMTFDKESIKELNDWLIGMDKDIKNVEKLI